MSGWPSRWGLCPDGGLAGDRAWLEAQAGHQAAGVAQLFAHLGLAAVDAVAEERHGQAYRSYRERAATLPASEPQIKMLLARLCLGTRLNCLSRYLPKSVSQPALRIIDELLVATVAGCAGEDSAANLTAAIQSRALLAMRYEAPCPARRRRHRLSTSARRRRSNGSSPRRVRASSWRERSRALCAACGNESRLGGQMRRRGHSRRWSWTS